MRTLCGILLALAALPTSSFAQSRIADVYSVDQSHSLLDFTIRLVGFNRVRGSFGEWRSDFFYDPAQPTSGLVSFSANISSISTRDAERDQHLQGPDFFHRARFPFLAFQGHVVAAAGTRFEIEGMLTIRDSTRIIRFPLELAAPEATDPFGNRRLVFAGSVTINRRDFGVIGPKFWNHAISDSVSIEMELAGRIWNYRALAFGRKSAYYGPALVTASDSGRLEQAIQRLRKELTVERGSARLPTAFEVEVAVGRLIQAGRLADALRVLDFFASPMPRTSTARDRSSLEAGYGEVLLRLGRNEEASRHLNTAIQLDPRNTNALTLRRVAEAHR